MGRTEKNTLKTKRKERNHKEQHITQSLHRWKWVGLLKNTLKTNTKKGITKEQHITQSLLIGEMGRTVEKL
jgi:hypothetical protein